MVLMLRHIESHIASVWSTYLYFQKKLAIGMIQQALKSATYVRPDTEKHYRPIWNEVNSLDEQNRET